MRTIGGGDRPARRAARPVGRARTVGSRLALTGAVASLAFAVLAPGAGAQSTDTPLDLPDSFVGAASAQAMGVTLLTPPLLPVEGLFAFGVAEGRGSYDPTNQEARASLFFPGEGAIKGPGLVCSQMQAQFPPESEPLFGPIFSACLNFQFPLAVFADSLNPQGQTEGAVVLGERADPISLEAAGARAHAAIEATTTDAEVNDLRIIGAPAIGSLDALLQAAGMEETDGTVVTVDGMTATTDQRIAEGGELVVESRATVTGVRILGGLVRIGSVVSVSSVTHVPGEEPVLTSTIEASGVEVVGTPAQLTDEGLVLPGSPSGPITQQLNSQVAAFLQDSGFRMQVLPTEQGESSGVPFALAEGLLVEFSVPLGGLPPVPGPLGDMDINGRYGVRLQLGTTGARGFADAFDDGDLTTGGGGGAVAGGGGAPSPGFVPPASPGGATATPAPQTPAAEAPGDAPAQPSSALADILADRLAFLYLSFTLTALGLCLAPRLMLPARLPRAASST